MNNLALIIVVTVLALGHQTSGMGKKTDGFSEDVKKRKLFLFFKAFIRLNCLLLCRKPEASQRFLLNDYTKHMFEDELTREMTNLVLQRTPSEERNRKYYKNKSLKQNINKQEKYSKYIRKFIRFH